MLSCPIAPIRRLISAGIKVGIGLDSPASSGPIDMFAEMQAALLASRVKGEPVSAEGVWQMATTMGAKSLWFAKWRLDADWSQPFLAIETDAQTTEELIMQGKPERIRWIDPKLDEACGPNAD